MTVAVNPALDPTAVPPADLEAHAFHRALPGYAPTPVRALRELAGALGVAEVLVKDETLRLGLPAFKVLGASWAVERALRRQPAVTTLVAASAGNHGRAVARVAADRGLACRIYLPARSALARREAIGAEGAEVVVVGGSYELAVEQALRDAADPATTLIADVGDDGTAVWVIDGYATLFTETVEQARPDLLLVPVGVGSLAAAAARFAAPRGLPVIGVEPATAACLTASLRAGRPQPVPTPGTQMAGLDCAEVSPAAWPSLKHGIAGTVTVTDPQAIAAGGQLAEEGLSVGQSGAATLAGLRRLLEDPGCLALRTAAGLGPTSRVLLLATEGVTDGSSPEACG